MSTDCLSDSHTGSTLRPQMIPGQLIRTVTCQTVTLPVRHQLVDPIGAACTILCRAARHTLTVRFLRSQTSHYAIEQSYKTVSQASHHAVWNAQTIKITLLSLKSDGSRLSCRFLDTTIDDIKDLGFSR